MWQRSKQELGGGVESRSTIAPPASVGVVAPLAVRYTEGTAREWGGWGQGACISAWGYRKTGEGQGEQLEVGCLRRERDRMRE